MLNDTFHDLKPSLGPSWQAWFAKLAKIRQARAEFHSANARRSARAKHAGRQERGS